VPAVTVQEEKEDEEAVENARNNFSAYRADDGDNNLITGIAVLIVVLAAGTAGAGLRGRPRRGGAVAYARSEIRRGRDA
jgi:hypothetical protein